MTGWDPRTYGRFEAERRRPCQDLLARIPGGRGGQIVDLGCGSGLSTRELAGQYSHSEIIGVDTSEDMLAAARARVPEARFVKGDAALWRGEAGLIFANALFQWVPDHLRVMARLIADMPPGGRIAAQMPDNEAEPSHVLMRATGAAAPFREKLAGAGGARETIGAMSDYDEALSPFCDHVDIWRTVYLHRLESAEAIVDWVKGAGLRPYLAPLTRDERALYLESYRDAIAAAYPRRPWGGVLFPFPRLFVVARRASAGESLFAPPDDA